MTTYLIAASATKADCLLAGLIFGVVLMLVGRGIIWAVCNLRDERTAREAERIVTHPHVSPAAMSPAAQEAWEAAPFNMVDARAAEHMQSFIERLAPVGDVIPMQRDRRGGA